MTIDFNSIDELKKAGFSGFKTMGELFRDSSLIPKVKGGYLVLNPDYSQTPDFLQVGTGGHFKGKNPNVSLGELKANRVDNALVVYIGKAGGATSNATLQSRLKQYFRFGQGANVGTWGGRLIWQLKNAKEPIVRWKSLSDEEPQAYETNLIREFVRKFSKRPFANLTD
jgi:hypothetical protein